MEKFWSDFSDWLYAMALGGFGGAASHVFLNRGKKFVVSLFLGNVFIAMFAAKALGGFVPPSEYRDSLLMLLGFFAYPILTALEATVVERVLAFFKRVFP